MPSNIENVDHIQAHACTQMQRGCEKKDTLLHFDRFNIQFCFSLDDRLDFYS